MPRSNSLLHSILPWGHAWLLVVIIAVSAVCLAMAAHTLSNVVINAFASGTRYLWLHTIINNTRKIRGFAALIICLAVLMPLAPLSQAASDTVSRLLLASFIVFVGWLCVVSINIGFEFYARRFNMGSTDNLAARKVVTQVRVLRRTLDIFVILIATGFALMSFDSVRQFGVSLFASAGVAGLAAGLAARPLLSNLVAGVQIAITQPIRLGDVLVVQGNWGTVEEITSTYVVMKIWDLRRLIIPLSFFFDTPFENWTRTSGDLLGTVIIYADYRVPIARIRSQLETIVKKTALWDHRTVVLQVTDANHECIQLRALVSARNSSDAWDLRCHVREELIKFLSTLPDSLPRRRAELSSLDDPLKNGSPFASAIQQTN